MLNAAKYWEENQELATHCLFPVTAELIRRAQLPKAIELETTNLVDLWETDEIPQHLVRDQLRALLNLQHLGPLTRNNIVVLCGYWFLWGETTAQGLQELRRLEPSVEPSEVQSWLNYMGLRAKAEAVSGDFDSAYLSLLHTEKALNHNTHLRDLWVISVRLNMVCNKIGFLQHGLAFAHIAYAFAKVGDNAIQLANAKMFHADSLIDTGCPDQAVIELESIMRDSLAGSTWIAPLNLPLLPLFLANGRLLQNRHSSVSGLLSQSLDFESSSLTLYSDMQRDLTRAELQIRAQNTKTAAIELQKFTEKMLLAEHINLRMVDRGLKLYAAVRGSDRCAHANNLLEWREALRPEPLKWLPLLAKIQTLLTNLSKQRAANGRHF